MADLTYTAEGTFDNARDVSIALYIPKEPFQGTYETKIYNLSKNTSDGVVNVLFCHFSNQTDVPLSHDKLDYSMQFNLNDLESHPLSVAFDERNENALFLFFHNATFDESDRDLYFDEIENIYEYVRQNGNQNQDGLVHPEANASHSTPRKIGLSIVTKSIT